MIKDDKEIIICSKCFSSNIIPDKGLLPGGAAGLEFSIGYLCLDCGNKGHMLLIERRRYKGFKKKIAHIPIPRGI